MNIALFLLPTIIIVLSRIVYGILNKLGILNGIIIYFYYNNNASNIPYSYSNGNNYIEEYDRTNEEHNKLLEDYLDLFNRSIKITKNTIYTSFIVFSIMFFPYIILFAEIWN